MSRSAPAIPLFGDAYLADTRHLSLEEHGAYLQLMMIAWRTDGCCLPDDDNRIARMLGVSASKWAKLKPTVMDFWDLEDGVWKQHRLTKERNFVDEKRIKNSSSAKSRWNSQPIENIDCGKSERISEGNAPPPPPPPNSNSVGKPTAAEPQQNDPIEPAVETVDPLKVMFDSGIRLLGQSGTPEHRARPMLGKWRQRYGAEAVITALGAAQREGAIDPISFIEGSLKNGQRPNSYRDGRSAWLNADGTGLGGVGDERQLFD